MSEFIPQTITLQGKEYLEVAPRVLWLRREHPDALIHTELMEHDRVEAWGLFRAIITIPSTGGSATGWGHAAKAELRGPVATNYLEKAETKAIGRACAGLGFGTLGALEEDGETLADAPVARPAPKPAPHAVQRPATAPPPQSPASAPATAPAARVVAPAAYTPDPAPGEMPAPGGDTLTQIRKRVLATVFAEPYNWAPADVVAALREHARPGLQTANEANATEWAKLDAAISRLGVEALPSMAAFTAIGGA